MAQMSTFHDENEIDVYDEEDILIVDLDYDQVLPNMSRSSLFDLLVEIAKRDGEDALHDFVSQYRWHITSLLGTDLHVWEEFLKSMFMLLERLRTKNATTGSNTRTLLLELISNHFPTPTYDDTLFWRQYPATLALNSIINIHRYRCQIDAESQEHSNEPETPCMSEEHETKTADSSRWTRSQILIWETDLRRVPQFEFDYPTHVRRPSQELLDATHANYLTKDFLGHLEEVHRLHDSISGLNNTCDAVIAERDQALAEVARLKAENARLRMRTRANTTCCRFQSNINPSTSRRSSQSHRNPHISSKLLTSSEQSEHQRQPMAHLVANQSTTNQREKHCTMNNGRMRETCGSGQLETSERDYQGRSRSGKPTNTTAPALGNRMKKQRSSMNAKYSVMDGTHSVRSKRQLSAARQFSRASRSDLDVRNVQVHVDRHLHTNSQFTSSRFTSHE